MSPFAAELRALIENLIPGETADDDSAGALHLWHRLCALGLYRIGTEEERGGSGGTLDDLLLVTEALASRGAGVPIVESSVADWILGHASPPGES